MPPRIGLFWSDQGSKTDVSSYDTCFLEAKLVQGCKNMIDVGLELELPVGCDHRLKFEKMAAMLFCMVFSNFRGLLMIIPIQKVT